MGRLFGTDGIRGIANTELDPTLAFKLGKASAQLLAEESKKRGTFVIGHDGRISSDMLCCALISGICSAGHSVISAGIIPTPAVAYLTKKYSADAGIVVSASHNSFEYNGIKIFDKNGSKLSDILEEAIESAISSESSITSQISHGDVGRIIHKGDPAGEYASHVKSSSGTLLSGLRIALDCSNGACSHTAEKIFKDLGAELHLINASPNGININDRCGSTHPEALSTYVKAHSLDAGAAFDGDGDRCICVDENGDVFDGDKIMALCASELLKKGRLTKNTVVGTVMTNLGLIKFFDGLGIRFIATKVGDKFVSEEMSANSYAFGGEQSGHIIFGEHSSTGDGQLTALQVFSIMKSRKQKLSDLASIITLCPQYTRNVPITKNGKLHFSADKDIERSIKNARDKLTGGRIIVRPSGTEPLIRIMAEGYDEKEVLSVALSLEKEISEALKKYE